MIVNDTHFEYLVIQKGDISNYRNDRTLWEKAYEESIEAIFDSIKGVLPEKCKSILDIGSGLGGIDIRINRHYNESLSVTLLDGLEDDPVVEKHAQTFNNMAVAKDFHTLNGTKKFDYFTPETANKYFIDRLPGKKYDLIVSFASYCFHYSPETYLDFLLKVTKKDTVLVFDVRIDKPQWLLILLDHFEVVDVVYHAKKFERFVFKKK